MGIQSVSYRHLWFNLFIVYAFIQENIRILAHFVNFQFDKTKFFSKEKDLI